ncbi:MAG: protease pro-enzyme activation domain-containing protein, partial [Polyangia bacterium]
MSSVSQPILVLPALAQAFAFFFATLGAASVAVADEAPTAPSPEPPAATTATAQDLGPTTPSQIVTASLILKVRHPDALERAVASTQDPNGGSYHRFLSLGNFVAQYAPSAGDIAAIERYLARFGIRVTDVYANQLLLKATGTADAFNRAFTTDIHDYAKQGRCFHRPRHAPAIPVLLRDLLLVVGGLSDEALFRPMHVSAATPGLLPKTLPQTTPALPTAGATATGVPGSYTVGDVANLYNINPLYRAHIDGTGRTIGIATLANFVPDDAYTYWALAGLNVNPNRIRQVHVDGGGELSSVAGSVETALDVQQAGGLAPG